MKILIKDLLIEGYLPQQITEMTAQEARRKFDTTGNTAERIAGGISAIPGVGSTGIGLIPRAVANYQTGDALGHRVAGTLLGREAALGAASKHTPGISVGDVYTKNNMINKAIGGFGAMAGVMGTNHLIGDGNPMVDAIGLTAPLTSMTIAPAMSYGLGKVFGSRKPTR